MTVGHRVRQFARHLSAQVDRAEEEAALVSLPRAAADLFRATPVADRRHGLDVRARLLASGVTDPDLLAAALLHDAAKGHRLRLWHRVAVVLLDALPGDGVRRLARPDPTSWRYPFHLQLHHAELSAVAVESAGCSSRTAAFIRGAVADADRQLLAALEAADAAS